MYIFAKHTYQDVTEACVKHPGERLKIQSQNKSISIHSWNRLEREGKISLRKRMEGRQMFASAEAEAG